MEFRNFHVNHCAPLGSYCNPVVITKVTQDGDTDIFQAETPFISCIDTCCKVHCFYMYLPECLQYGDMNIIKYTEDGIVLYDVCDRVGNYMRADRLLPYDQGKRLIKCIAGTDPLHIDVVSDVLPTHFNCCCDTVIVGG